MGWYFEKGDTKADLIEEITQESPRQPGHRWSNEEQQALPTGYDVSHKTLQHKLRGNVLWTVEEVVHYKEKEERHRFIGCYLLDKQDGDWGYKPMDESMGPYQYTCPLEYLDMVPEANAGWREGVRNYHDAIQTS